MQWIRHWFANRRLNRMVDELLIGNPNMTRAYASMLIGHAVDDE